MAAQLTPAQRKVIAGLEVIGGTGWLGPNIVNGRFWGYGHWLKSVKSFYGDKEYRRIKGLLPCGDKGVRCSTVTLTRLMELGAIEPVSPELAVYRLTGTNKEIK